MQGHFVDTLLDPVYKDSGLIYDIWKFLRGITAPVFFTISGFIFTYLLMKVAGSPKENLRLKKGIKRGLLLIVLGYLLRVPVFQWLIGEFDNRVFIVDVLQCIGLSLILIVISYYVSLKNKNVMLLLHFLIWLAMFQTKCTQTKEAW